MGNANGAIALHLVTHLLAEIGRRDPTLLEQVGAGLACVAKDAAADLSIHDALATVTTIASRLRAGD